MVVWVAPHGGHLRNPRGLLEPDTNMQEQV